MVWTCVRNTGDDWIKVTHPLLKRRFPVYIRSYLHKQKLRRVLSHKSISLCCWRAFFLVICKCDMCGDWAHCGGSWSVPTVDNVSIVRQFFSGSQEKCVGRRSSQRDSQTDRQHWMGMMRLMSPSPCRLIVWCCLLWFSFFSPAGVCCQLLAWSLSLALSVQ